MKEDFLPLYLKDDYESIMEQASKRAHKSEVSLVEDEKADERDEQRVNKFNTLSAEMSDNDKKYKNRDED